MRVTSVFSRLRRLERVWVKKVGFPEEHDERLMNGILDRLIAGKRGEREILGAQTGCWAS